MFSLHMNLGYHLNLRHLQRFDVGMYFVETLINSKKANIWEIQRQTLGASEGLREKIKSFRFVFNSKQLEIPAPDTVESIFTGNYL